MKTKFISVLLLVLLIFNFICCSLSYAEEADSKKPVLEKVYVDDDNSPSPNVLSSGDQEGEYSKTTGSEEKVQASDRNYGASIVGAITGIFARIINLFILQIDIIMAQLTYSTENSKDFKYWLTIERLVFNRVPLVNINYFDTEPTYSVGDLEINANNNNIEVKKSIAGAYYICRFIAMALGLVVLIYIGIKMAISTIASDQAKYKKMLVGWVESIIVIFLMLYIISIVINFGELITEVLYKVEQTILEGEVDKKVFEETIRSRLLHYTFSFSGLQLTFWSIMYWCLLIMEAKFLWTYLKRFLMIGFLIVISPLITITYSIDKAGDGRAQAFDNWTKEFITNVLIQPLHALIYMVFVLTANNIADKSPIVAIAFLLSMGTVEKMVKTVFNLTKATSLGGIAEVKLLKK